MIIKEGERVPFGYGFVTYRFECNAIEVLPMPFNYIKRWWLTRFSDSSESSREKTIRAAYQEGYRAGVAEGQTIKENKRIVSELRQVINEYMQ